MRRFHAVVNTREWKAGVVWDWSPQSPSDRTNALLKLRVHLLCLLQPSLLHGDIELQKSLRLILAPGSGYEEIFISKLIKQSSKLIKVISRFITQPSTVIQNLEEEDDTGLDISPPVPRPVSLVH